jgi:hypothetical protein
VSLVNFTPTSTALVSVVDATTGVVVLLHNVAFAIVVKVQETGAITFPERSLAPLTIAVYVVEVASAELGVSVAVFVVLLYPIVPATAPPGPVSVNTMLPDCTGLLNVAVAVVLTDTPVAPEAGVKLVSAGGVVSVVLVLNETSTQ